MQFYDLDMPHSHLEIVSDRPNPNAKLLVLEVQPSVTGIFSLDSGLSDESLCLKELSQMGIKDVMENFSSQATSMNDPLLKSAIHREAASAKSSHPKRCFDNWSVPPSGFGNVHYTSSYWEWVEDMLPHHKETLEHIKIYDAIYTSLFTYDYDDVIHTFCELWCPSTNTLSTFIGEIFISLWDPRAIGGLPIQGAFYDEAIPLAKGSPTPTLQAQSYLINGHGN